MLFNGCGFVLCPYVFCAQLHEIPLCQMILLNLSIDR